MITQICIQTLNHNNH